MKQDRWTHSLTRVEYGTTGPLGSPRAWLRRALDTPIIQDVSFKPGSLTTHEISVAGIWYRQPEGYGIPITGSHRELFRYWSIPADTEMTRPRPWTQLHPVIGMCAAVPMSEVLHWIDVYKRHGAVFTWWNTPQDCAVRAVEQHAVEKTRRTTNHEQVFKLLDLGLTRKAISEQLDLPMENLAYITKKWERQRVKA